MRSYGEFQCPEAAVYSIVRFPGIIPRKLGFGEVVVMQGVIRYFGAGGIDNHPNDQDLSLGPEARPRANCRYDGHRSG